MKTDRYQAILAMMDDPMNMACVLRELQRRGEPKIVPPPLKRELGKWYPSLDWSMRNPQRWVNSIELSETPFAQVFLTNSGWRASITAPDLEMGPYNTEDIATKELENFLKGEGYLLLTRSPWSEEDQKEWRITSKRLP